GVTKAEAPATSKAKPAPKPKADKPAKAKTKSKAKPEETTGTRPEALKAPRDGGADDLKMIKGVGPKLEQLLHGLGFYHFDQVAAWTADEVAWVDQNLEGFKGRVSRDSWVDQARVLAQGGTTEFSKKVKKGDVY
ncbi:MAG: fused NADH-quinone oxidoreductase subunit E/endonuclease, partial [Rhodobacteraceae bacterium]|nr:fused NADH-quinone oxidoreductase subunit E/endonuclease [Paracoccaceae bacterium]